MALEKGNGSEEQMSVDIKSGEEYREETTDYDDGTGIAEGQEPETPEDDRLKAMDIAETAGDVAGEDLQEPGAVAESIVTDQLTDVVSDPEYTAAPETERPMSYADVVNETNGAPASQLPLFVPAGNGREADELLFPPFSPPGRKKGTFVVKTILWVTSVLVVAMAIFLIFKVTNKGVEEKQSNEKVPNNSSAKTSYAEEISIPEAPQVSVDPDGPQISTLTSETDKQPNLANAAFMKASPSVVCITSYKSGEDYVLDKIGDGSGIIISADGYIATNSHVIDDNKKTGVLVTLANGDQYLGAIIGVDKKTDLAVLKIDAKGLTAAEFADSDKLFVGQEVYAIGNPGGSNYSNSLTTGTVSALNRTLSTNGYVRYIQTDAAINPGNSGGPLINDNGQVIGMNTAKIVNTKYEGMGFSIPSNKVAEIVNKLIRYGYVNDRGTIGIQGTTCNLYESKLKNVPQGMVITSISATGALAGLDVRTQDIITAINGVRVKSSIEFIDELSKYKPGDVVTLSIFRVTGRETMPSYTFEVEVTLQPDN